MQNVAQTIVQQLGGNQFVLLTGASNFSKTDDSVTFHLPRNASKANRCTITLDYAHDAYKVEFRRFNSRTCELSTVAIAEQMYCDQLADYFTDITGLYTTFGPSK